MTINKNHIPTYWNHRNGGAKHATVRTLGFPQKRTQPVLPKGWKDLDLAVDRIVQKASTGFAALLEFPVALLHAFEKNNGGK